MIFRPVLAPCAWLILLSFFVSSCASTGRGPKSSLSPQEARSSYQEAEQYYQTGMYQLSYEKFAAAAESGYQPEASRINAGASLLSLRQSKQAVPVLEKAVREHPTSADGWYNYGLALYGAGKFDEAISALQKSANLDQAKADVWTALGASFMAKRQPGVAVEQFTRALKLAPGNTTILADRAGAYLDSLLYKEAEQDYRRVLESGTDGAIAHMGLGDVYLAQKKCRQAEEQLNKAIDLAPSSGMAYYNRGIVRQQCGSYTKALDDYTTALAFEPGLSEALVMRGDTHLMLQHADLACKDLVAACELGNCARLDAVRTAGFCPRF